MNTDFNSKILLPRQIAAQMNQFTPSQIPGIVDSLTGKFFEELYEVINESKNFLTTSAKEIEELQSESNLISSMQEKISREAKSLVNCSVGLKEELVLERSLLKKINFAKNSERM
ncbi:unnamed protein product [Blepharisma stoltei]|uniref:Uncharacterized protein n=1 Tax=Blepharisma stoltei TaxID=1481888 RepID=A0AAU9INU6_9CILI|nr:unnamed protein product [Blepharisma stoltei]